MDLTVFIIWFIFQIWDRISMQSMPYLKGFPHGSVLKNLPAMQELQEMWVWSQGQEDLLEEAVAIRSIFLPGEFHG